MTPCQLCHLDERAEDLVDGVCPDCRALGLPEHQDNEDLIAFLRQRIAAQDKALNEALLKEIWYLGTLNNWQRREK